MDFLLQFFRFYLVELISILPVVHSGVFQHIVTPRPLPFLPFCFVSATKHAIPVTIQRELDSIMRTLRGGLIDIGNRRVAAQDYGSSAAALTDIFLVLPMANATSGNLRSFHLVQSLVHTLGFLILFFVCTADCLNESNLVKHAKSVFQELFC